MSQYPLKPYVPAAPVKPCHTDGTLIFTSKGTSFYAGKYTGVSKCSYDLIIDLANQVTSTVAGINTSKRIKKFVDQHGAQLMRISWHDYSVISWSRETFQELLDAIHADKLESVYVCCIGGHGRTGTMMSILAGLSGAVPEGECPVTWLRELYCDRVVESTEQLDYVEKITGLKVKASAGKPMTYQGNLGGYYGGSYHGGGSSWQKQVYGSRSEFERIEYDGKYSKPN